MTNTEPVRDGELHPLCTYGEKAIDSQLLQNDGGDDGTRTRGLCRDRAAF